MDELPSLLSSFTPPPLFFFFFTGRNPEHSSHGQLVSFDSQLCMPPSRTHRFFGLACPALYVDVDQWRSPCVSQRWWLAVFQPDQALRSCMCRYREAQPIPHRLQNRVLYRWRFGRPRQPSLLHLVVRAIPTHPIIGVKPSTAGGRSSPKRENRRTAWRKLRDPGRLGSLVSTYPLPCRISPFCSANFSSLSCCERQKVARRRWTTKSWFTPTRESMSEERRSTGKCPDMASVCVLFPCVSCRFMNRRSVCIIFRTQRGLSATAGVEGGPPRGWRRVIAVTVVHVICSKSAVECGVAPNIVTCQHQGRHQGRLDNVQCVVCWMTKCMANAGVSARRGRQSVCASFCMQFGAKSSLVSLDCSACRRRQVQIRVQWKAYSFVG